MDWKIEEPTIEWAAADGRVPEIQEFFTHAYDPRVTWLEDRYYVTWCNGYYGPTIGVGYTYDFESFHQLENAFLPFNRNGVLFPRKIKGMYRCCPGRATTATRLSATSTCRRAPTWCTGAAPPGDDHGPYTWESTKVGAGPTPIETRRGGSSSTTAS